MLATFDVSGSYSLMMDDWFYFKGGQRFGPIAQAQVQALLQAGELAKSDLVWRKGMSDWSAVDRIQEFGGTVTTPLDYAQQKIPPRAAHALRGYGAPNGDASAWPLNENDLAHFVAASRFRRIIRRGASLYRGIAIISALAIPFFAALPLMASPYTFQVSATDILSGLLISVVTAVVCGIGMYGTLRNQKWGPYSVAGILLATLLLQFAISIPSLTAGGDEVVIAIAANIVSAAFTGLFLITTFRAAWAIKQLRATPAWCQEALAAAKW